VPPFFHRPSFEVRALVARFSRPLGELTSPPALHAALRPGDPPRATWEAVTRLLGRFGRRPSHSLRPGGERVGLAALCGRLRPINVVVDAAMATALRFGLPISLADLARLRAPLRVTALPRATRMRVDALGTTADCGGWRARADVDGPRLTPVAVDAGALTTAATRTTLSVLWGTRALGLDDALAHHRELLLAAGAECELIELPGPAEDPTGRALLARVLADLDDDAARLAFADWLEAHEGACGRRRARFIRDAIAGRLDHALYHDVVADAELSGWPVGWSRGFVGRACLTRYNNPPLTPRLADQPLEEVSLDQVELAAPVPATVRRFSVWNPNLRRVPHPAPERLRELQLSGEPDPDVWAWLASLPNLDKLWMHIGDATPWQLPPERSLQLLHLQGGSFTAASLSTLPIDHLVDLELNRVALDDITLRALPPTPRLTRLRLCSPSITTLAPFVRAPLRELLVWSTPLAASDVAHITAMTDLEVLYVAECPALEGPLTDAIDAGALPVLRQVDGRLYPRRRAVARRY
jgi:uncharacterized protein (TIGR02996 family)